MELKPRAPIERMSGKVNGQNSHESTCTSKVTGKVWSYHWPEGYVYPQVAARVAQVDRLKATIKMGNELLKNPETKAQLQAEYEAYMKKWVKNPKLRPYRRLRDYVMAKCAAKLKEEAAENKG